MSLNTSPNGKTATTKSATPVVTFRPYEAPAIESIVTFDNLQREVLYAGAPTTAPVPVP